MLLLFTSMFLGASSLDAVEVKHDWSKKKIKTIESIIKMSSQQYKDGLVSLDELTYWNKRLYKEKKKKLNVEYEYKVKENPKLKGVDFEDDISYVSSLLKISIQRVNFYEKLLPSIKDMVEIGMLYGKDLTIFKLNAMDAYANYDYILTLYKYHTKTRIPYKLPLNVVEKLNLM